MENLLLQETTEVMQLTRHQRLRNKKGDNEKWKQKQLQNTLECLLSSLSLITDLVRGKDLNEALNILKFTPGKGSEIVEKVVKSAAANAENNFNMNPDNLYVAEVYANQGPTMKRWRAGSQGRASIILKRSSHVGVTLKEKN